MQSKRVTRAYIAGLGTAGSLLAGASVLFVVATAVVAYRGWPQVADAGPAPALVLAQTTQYGVGPTTSPAHLGAVAAHVATRAVAVSAATTAGRGRTGVATQRRTTAASTLVAGVPRGPARQPTTQPPPANTTPPASPTTPPPTGPSTGGGGLGTVATTATGALGAGVSSAGSQVGDTVGTVTGALGGQLSQASPAVGGLVAGLGQALGSTVSQATGTVGGVVTGTGQLLGGILGGLGQR